MTAAAAARGRGTATMFGASGERRGRESETTPILGPTLCVL